jgi:ABC-type sugar transport system permease subunit
MVQLSTLTVGLLAALKAIQLLEAQVNSKQFHTKFRRYQSATFPNLKNTFLILLIFLGAQNLKPFCQAFAIN